MEHELVLIPQKDAMTVFTTEDALDPFLARIRQEIDAFVPDVSTVKGRKEVASIAHKVARSKTYLDGVGKALADEVKLIPKKIDASRKHVRDTLDAWKDEVRLPLTEWEAIEDARVAKHRENIAGMGRLDQPNNDNGWPFTAAEKRAHLAILEEIAIDGRCEEFEAEYARAKDAAVTSIKALIASLDVKEAEQAELARLRKEAEERAAKDREEAIRREAAERAKAEAEAAAQREADRIEAEAKAAREKAEAAARSEREAAERRELELRLAAEAAERRAAETEQRIKREAEEAKAAQAREIALREADTKHKGAINRAAVAALVAGGLTEQAAKTAITLIAKRAVPSVVIQY